MSLIDDCNELPSMENWLNAGADWAEHHGIIEPTPSASAPLLFYGHADPSSTPGSAISLFEVKEAVITHPFLKLDAQEICKENPDALLVRTGSPSRILSEHQGNSATTAPSASSLLDRTPSSDVGASLYLEGDSPRGPLSPAALQLGKRSPKPVSNNKRPLVEDASDGTSWMPGWDLQTPSRKSPKQQQQQQSPVGYAPYVAMAAATPPLAMPTAAAPPTFLPVPAAAGNAAMAAPAILFPTPLTLPNVPSMEEIAQTRPKRRNVRISKDPTSVAARHRRERISDRVRVLQHFVPGGTKMDTASMLDEAIHYVKFLQQQLQILERLGSSYDPRFMSLEDPVMMPPGGHSVRPFDLNRACYPTYPSTSMAQPTSSSQQQPLLPTWPTTKTTSPFCSQGFPDSAQEQFCH